MSGTTAEEGVRAASQAPVLARSTADLRAALGPAAVRLGEPLSQHTTLRAGGPADILAVVDNIDALQQAVRISWEYELPCRVLGSGANVLVSDTGVRGVVILNRARRTTISSTTAQVESGALISMLARQCVAKGLAGLEWATGIPGTVGGALVGNAGAWGGSVASTLVAATVLEPAGSVTVWRVERFGYDYRTSILKRWSNASDRRAVVLDAHFALKEADRQVLQVQAARIAAQRKEKQPPGATCGSVFKNPEGDYAGRLIEAAGLKGQHQGDAEISMVHANFIVNRGRATAEDVKVLIDFAQDAVKAQTGTILELEIEMLGDW